jgi:hypothetical protein
MAFFSTRKSTLSMAERGAGLPLTPRFLAWWHSSELGKYFWTREKKMNGIRNR